MEVDASKGGVHGGLRSALDHDMVLPAEHLGNGHNAIRKRMFGYHFCDAGHVSQDGTNQNAATDGWGVIRGLNKN